MSQDNINNQDELDPEDELRMDNKIKRLELELKGAKFIEHNPQGIELPPEVEAQMLDQILQFEKMKGEAKEVKIYEFLGKPRYKKIETLTSEEIILEKERILKLMEKKGIILGSMETVDDTEMYRFITEELFEKMMLDMPIKGFIRHFIYEEFHPNEELNAKKTIEFFFQAYMTEDVDLALSILCRDEAISYLKNFKELYDSMELETLEIRKTSLKKRTGYILIQLEFNAFMDHSLKAHKYSGEIKVSLKKRKDVWQISELIFPKLN